MCGRWRLLDGVRLSAISRVKREWRYVYIAGLITPTPSTRVRRRAPRYQPLELRALLYSERNASRMNATTMFRKSSTPMT